MAKKKDDDDLVMEEEAPVEGEEEASAEEGTADPVPGAPDPEAEAADEPMAALPGDGWAQLKDTDRVAELGVAPGTRVQIVNATAEAQPDSYDPYHPVVTVPQDGEVVVRTRDARGETVSVTLADLEPVGAGVTKG